MRNKYSGEIYAYTSGLVYRSFGSITGCSLINTEIITTANKGYVGGLVGQAGQMFLDNLGSIKGCMFYGSLVIDSADKGNFNLAVGLAYSATYKSIYCQNLDSSTDLLWNSNDYATPFLSIPSRFPPALLYFPGFTSCFKEYHSACQHPRRSFVKAAAEAIDAMKSTR